MKNHAHSSTVTRLDRSRHAAPQVFERLREMILSLELTPGTVLSRTELANRYGLSQTPVRDALMKLGEEGLVDIYPQHATVVSQINVTSALQAHFLRRSIELEVVRTLAEQRDATLIAELRLTIARQTEVLDLKNYEQFSLLDQAFHRQMYEAAGVPQLWDLVRRLSGHIDRLRRLNLPVEGKTIAVVRDHTEIVDAIDKGDVEAAQAALRKHLSGTLSQIDQIRTSHPNFLADE
ncbi:DNA-binding GntR family transcriptional regulator [Paraburkholderia sp. RAU6.4a]|uniref:GntR family transcriptional regulator n=1 Tax=unclassified Paraburkholderia TaxID=2615204 RepID=UPI001610ABEB|nr:MULTISPECIES: GntR family transcriptional regulator [unclassified Paraburkholderia]MBB5407732.1 DNA-binding GntR family transcriptional regulator [Paraburkholderia sp. HC6.4b]MBC8726385.1 GntR family transcriptional regulator [Paraburkholderia sp. 31.1]MBC8731524.1 GntR family transcriptional regulator [Paraburkholderia sp. UCT2]